MIRHHPVFACSWLCSVMLIGAMCTGAEVDEEFVGPFASWRDLRRDYGAVGDGKADDTAALQRALDELTKHETTCVLYIPAGQYRLTQPLKTVRVDHGDFLGVSIIGEDPQTTVLIWDGDKDGTMFYWNAWYSKISRLTFDGKGQAAVALQYGPTFSTFNESSDLILRDVGTGVMFGTPESQGQAENEVVRCQFIRCKHGVQTANWNSMDIWVWYCRFEDCDRGILNQMGNWHAWQNLFLRSKTADLSTHHLMVFSVVNNVSIGSRCFFDFGAPHSWGSPVSITGNQIEDTTGDWAMVLGNAGPYLLVDNYFRLSGKARAVKMTWGDQIFVGNTYSKPNVVEKAGRFRRIDEKTTGVSPIRDAAALLPSTPARKNRKIIDVAVNADRAVIQQAIDTAVQSKEQRPIVHLPKGEYQIDQTLVIPAACDLQLVGDGGGDRATILHWTGAADGLVLRLEGPSRATLRDFHILANSGGRPLVVEDADQQGGRIFTDQLVAICQKQKSGTHPVALRINGLEKTNVVCRCLQGNASEGIWVEAIGGSRGTAAENQVSVFTGATGSARGQYDVKQGGKLVIRGVYHEKDGDNDSLVGLHLADSGILSVDATRFSYATSETTPTFAADGFRGMTTLAACTMVPVNTQPACRFELRGDGKQSSFLSLANQFWVHEKGTTSSSIWQNKTHPAAAGGLVGCNLNTSNQEVSKKGFEFFPNLGNDGKSSKSKKSTGAQDNQGADDATIVRHLALLRKAKVWQPDESVPKGATDVRIYRVMATGGRDVVVEFQAKTK